MAGSETQLKVVVTGASGFLGGHVLRGLALRRNIEVIAVTRQEIPGWIVVPDYSDSPPGDILIHLAEDADRARVAKAGLAHEEKMHASLRGLLAKAYSRVVYASSAVLYGDLDTRAHFPDDPVHVADAYTRIKSRSEQAVLESPAGTVARLANIYGPGMSQNNVMSTILRQIPGNGPLEIIDTTPVRDFVWVEDVARGIIELALCQTSERSEGGVYNLGTGVGTSIGALANMALEVAGQTERPVKAKVLSGRQSSLILDFSDTTAACGWIPRISLRQGLARLLLQGKE